MSKFNTTLKKALVVLAVAGLAFLPTATQALSEWGPESRPTFTWATPATYITFNSITDNPVVPGGDERRFHTVNKVGVNNHSHDITVQDNDEITLRTYFHNNAAADLNLVALNTRVKMLLSGGESTEHTSVSYITADNANPGAVWDTVHIRGSQPFELDYQEGSAKLFNNVFTTGTPLSDTIVTEAGAQVGYDQVNGRVPGCGQFSGWVTIRVKVDVKEVTPPAYSCNALTIVALDNRRIRISGFTTTATNGAVFKNATVDWGDNSTDLTDTNIIGKEHTYSRDGTYTIRATARFTVNGQEQTATGPGCVQQITVKGDQPPVVTPPTPTQTPTTPAPTKLVNTGPGEVVASLFAASSAAGAVAYRWMLGRRLSND